MKDKIKYMTILQALASVGVLIATGLVFGVVMSFISPKIGEYWASVISTLFYIPMFIVTLIFMSRQKRHYLKDNLRKNLRINWRVTRFYYVILGMIMIFVCNILLEPYTETLSKESLNKYYDLFMGGNRFVIFVVSVMCAPLLEEAVFRGYMYKGLEVRYNPIVAMLVVSVLFSAVHFSVVQSPSAFISSLVFCSIYILSGYSLSTVVFLHFMNNLIAFSFLYFIGNRVINVKSMMSTTSYYTLYAIAVVVLAIFLFVSLKYAIKHKKNLVTLINSLSEEESVK